MEIFIIKEIVFWVSAVAGVGAFLFMPVSVIHHHFRVQRPRQGFFLDLARELFWLVIPCLMILFMALPAGEEMVVKHLQGSTFFFDKVWDVAAIFDDANCMTIYCNRGIT